MVETNQQKILIVDDQEDFARGIKRLIEVAFPENEVLAAFNGEQALAVLNSQQISLMVSDLQMPGMSGLELLKTALAQNDVLSAVMLTAHGTVETAVDALKAGAYDFVTKPIEQENLFRVISKGLERSRLLEENRLLRAQIEQHKDRLLGQSPLMQQLKQSIGAVARTDYNVLIMGESGTGKELVAGMVRDLSSRADKPYVTVNCTAIPENLLESELFGHVKGAFSGADNDREGLFLRADGGTILLDEIGDIPLETQAKLLRVLQEGEIRPVGSDTSKNIDVRVLASTNQDLPQRVSEKTFREDLYHRLNVLPLNLPPLKQRTGDIPLLARYFAQKACIELGLPEKELDPAVVGHLSAQSWTGNVRELQNTMRKLAVFSTGESITMLAVDLAEGKMSADAGSDSMSSLPYKEAKQQLVDSFSRSYISDLLSRTGGNVSEAARNSGLSRVAVQKMLARFDLKSSLFKKD
ncbi:sigma-54-dependent transcriptional regulator [Maridesulfovibrio salexigens]|uniref:Two component, sigma54 specific, transcriptional regulator, Fis family n=1 Tax=Maridesulfovibrio salexigens (strain ATCC 14822 / DSM 2638 / NCIMB 8403 / VKM B-1763) TaxID=526222 RepID=C6BWZ9_MARSD|nr:sigma-54 dependent transcriptional regulator [Maridesulfovibrio salexigens]ACS78479.1 two component, sigma54 specific, transcriptional regulator, Fis family [Maridesulfovibrio salexigens DSM 2638]